MDAKNVSQRCNFRQAYSGYTTRARSSAAPLGGFFLPDDFGSRFDRSTNWISALPSAVAAQLCHIFSSGRRSDSISAFWHH